MFCGDSAESGRRLISAELDAGGLTFVSASYTAAASTGILR